VSGILFGERELRAIAERAMRAATGDQVEALIIGRTGSLTRFANSAIHQNVTSREAELRVRVVVGTRRATATTNRLDDDGRRRAAELASDLAHRAPEDATFPGLPSPRPIPSAPSAYVERTAEATPLDRARAAKTLCDHATALRLVAAGFVSTNVQEIAIASSLGTWAYAPQTYAEAQIAAIGDDGSAFAQRVSTDVTSLDVEGAAAEAVGKAAIAQHPRDLVPDTYEVVLAPYAVRDIVSFLGSQLSGLAIEEGRSFVGGKIGQQVTGPITLVEDAYDPRSIPRPFDFEGQPSDRLTLIEGGITRFWYTRWVHQLRTIVTGMTRDGTFAILDGEIVHPVKNFRFTQSYHEALTGVRGISKDLSLLMTGEQFGLMTSCQRVPALHLAAFTFTGATRY
jgi:predicted Zn-dependent protease